MKAKQRLAIESWMAQNHGIFPAFIDAYCVVDAHRRVVEFNDAFVDVVELPFREIKKAKSLADVLAFPDSSGCPASTILASGAPLRLDEITAMTAGGASRTLIISGVPALDPHGAVCGALLVLRDVTAEQELQAKYVQTRADSIIDGLTRLHNKTYMLRRIKLAVKAFLRDGQIFSLAFFDLDHFKSINDSHGHLAGDLVLKMFADALRMTARDTDLAGRFGGEEFVALLPKCGPDGAAIFAGRVMRGLAARSVEFQGKKISVTVSVGTASIDQSTATGSDADGVLELLLGRADEALYQAKRNGRNQVCQYAVPPKSRGA